MHTIKHDHNYTHRNTQMSISMIMHINTYTNTHYCKPKYTFTDDFTHAPTCHLECAHKQFRVVTDLHMYTYFNVNTNTYMLHCTNSISCKHIYIT